MSYNCQICGKNTQTHDTRGNIRMRKCTENHRKKSIEIPLDRYEAEQEELIYLRALKAVVQPKFNTSEVEFSPEPIFRRRHDNVMGLAGVCYKRRYANSEERYHARTHYRGKRITLYYGPDFFEACCSILSWKSKHDYQL